MTDLMNDRYGRGTKARWPLLLGGVIALAGLVWLAWAVWAQSNPQVTSAQVSFTIVDAHEARSTIEVHLANTSVHATCLLQATAVDHSVVGEVHFVVSDPATKDLQLTRSIRTARPATTVESIGCTAPGQKRPR